jgi:hypothetical protein
VELGVVRSFMKSSWLRASSGHCVWMKRLVLSLAALASIQSTLIAQDAVPIPEGEPGAVRHTVPYWNSIMDGGPIHLTLHLLLGISFVWALVSIFRRASTLQTVVWCLMPFIFGAIAMWIGVLGIIALIHVSDPYLVSERIHRLPRPFYLGVGVSFVAFVVFGVSRVFSRMKPPRNAGD